jgi:hypothetical protein
VTQRATSKAISRASYVLAGEVWLIGWTVAQSHGFASQHCIVSKCACANGTLSQDKVVNELLAGAGNDAFYLVTSRCSVYGHLWITKMWFFFPSGSVNSAVPQVFTILLGNHIFFFVSDIFTKRCVSCLCEDISGCEEINPFYTWLSEKLNSHH